MNIDTENIYFKVMNQKDIERLSDLRKIVNKKGRIFERKIASYFQTNGEFILRRVKVEHEQLTDADIIVYCFQSDYSEVKRLIECKSGKNYKFISELFKLLGVMTHLSIKEGMFFAENSHNQIELARDQFGKQYDILIFDNIKNKFPLKELIEEKKILKERINRKVLKICRMSYVIEDILCQNIVSSEFYNSNAITKIAKEMYKELMNNIWLESNPFSKGLKIYAEYKDNRKLPKKYAEEFLEKRIPSKWLNKAESLNAESLFYLEAKYRCVCLHSLCEALNKDIKGDHEQKYSNFIECIRYLKKISINKNIKVRQLSAFNQIFIFGWGGFILEKDREREITTIADQSRCNKRDVEEFLKIYDLLFPMGNYSGQGKPSWLGTTGFPSEWKLLKFVPATFRGIGIKMRKALFEENYFNKYSSAFKKKLNSFEKACDLYYK
ncbi:MAG: hypothetical protein ACOC56_05640 [Atribacterota bacterium]